VTAQIGILDLQGGVIEHLEHLERLGVRALRVKSADEMAGLAGLIIPGGESTCLSRLLRIFGLDVAIRRGFERGLKLWGTCAGAILLARTVVGEPPHLGLVDITVERNAFGSQLDSFECLAQVPRVADGTLPLTFIRAPKIRAVGPGVEVLLRIDDYVAAAESPEALVTVFHPELTSSVAFHRYFVSKCGLGLPDTTGRRARAGQAWSLTSWTRYARIATTAGPA
jgi:5'-phosphate synthase pdxT subunit